jgi:hypothetical protein
MAEQGYVGSSRDGWLNVKRAAGGAIVALPQYLSVEILSKQDGRTQFRVAEGVEAGAMFTAKQGILRVATLAIAVRRAFVSTSARAW